MPLDEIQTELGADRRRPERQGRGTERHATATTARRTSCSGALWRMAATSRWCRPSGRNPWCSCTWPPWSTRTTPVLFVDTQMLFTETLVYQAEVAERLGLTNVR